MKFLMAGLLMKRIIHPISLYRDTLGVVGSLVLIEKRWSISSFFGSPMPAEYFFGCGKQ